MNLERPDVRFAFEHDGEPLPAEHVNPRTHFTLFQAYSCGATNPTGPLNSTPSIDCPTFSIASRNEDPKSLLLAATREIPAMSTAAALPPSH